MQIIINESVAELISSKISYFQNILLKIIRRIGLKHKHCSLRHISCWKFKQNSHFKILIVKSFDEITIKMKVARSGKIGRLEGTRLILIICQLR